ncbi:MAG: hypothetical protein QXI19_12080 [Candidatus Caldarchaeum sp.]
MAEFASQEQIDAATQELRAWEQEFPEAAQKLKALWQKHLAHIGHKRLARILLGLSVKPYEATGES